MSATTRSLVAEAAVRLLRFCAVLALCVLAGSCARSSAQGTDLKAQMRKGAESDLQLPEAIQFVTFGPLLNGEVYEFKIRFHSGGGFLKIDRESRTRVFRIDFPRTQIAKVPIAVDAMLGCARSKELCKNMAQFLTELSQNRDPASAKFFDDMFPDSANVFATFRGTPEWGHSIREGLQQGLLVAEMHEICHAILGHLDGTRPTSAVVVRQEAEADGCMLAILKTAGYPASGGLPLLLDGLVRQESFGEFDLTHPSPVCRAVALTEVTVDWYARNEPAIRSAVEETQATAPVPPSAQLVDLLKNIKLQAPDCERYVSDSYAGHLKARRLVDANTKLRSSP